MIDIELFLAHVWHASASEKACQFLTICAVIFSLWWQSFLVDLVSSWRGESSYIIHVYEKSSTTPPFFLTFSPLFSHIFFFFSPYFLNISDWHRKNKKRFLGTYMTCIGEWTSLPISSSACNNFLPLMKSFLVDLISSWQGKSSYIVRVSMTIFFLFFPPFSSFPFHLWA